VSDRDLKDLSNHASRSAINTHPRSRSHRLQQHSYKTIIPLIIKLGTIMGKSNETGGRPISVTPGSSAEDAKPWPDVGFYLLTQFSPDRIELVRRNLLLRICAAGLPYSEVKGISVKCVAKGDYMPKTLRMNASDQDKDLLVSDVVGPYEVSQQVLDESQTSETMRFLSLWPQEISNPEISVYLSHVRAWAAALASGTKHNVVMEDRVFLREGFVEKHLKPCIQQLECLAENGFHYDVCYMYTNPLGNVELRMDPGKSPRERYF
jgi:hypothetical protein